MKNTCAIVGVVAVLAALLSACASTPAPEAKLVVPSISRVGELQKLSEQPAVVVNLKTVTGQEKWLLLERSDEAAFVGHAFDGLRAAQGMSQGPIERVPFNEVALVYYATPPHPFLSEVAPEHASFPSLPAPGLAEQGASCAELDVELARAEAIRWYARDSGAMALTSGEAAGKHVKNFAKDTGIAVLVFFALAAGGGGPCLSNCGNTSVNVLSGEDWRWAVTAAQRRVIGLLELKRAKHCEARVMADTSVSDMEVLEGIRSVQHEGSAGHLDDHAQVVQETVWLDKLNPAPLTPPIKLTASPVDPPGSYSGAVWVPNKSSYTVLGSTDPWRGAIELTDTALLLHRQPVKGETTGQEVQIPYADMASIETLKMIKARWIVITRRDGHVDSFWLSHGATIDRDRTEAVGELLKAKVPGKSADGAGK